MEKRETFHIQWKIIFISFVHSFIHSVDRVVFLLGRLFVCLFSFCIIFASSSYWIFGSSCDRQCVCICVCVHTMMVQCERLFFLFVEWKVCVRFFSSYGLIFAHFSIACLHLELLLEFFTPCDRLMCIFLHIWWDTFCSVCLSVCER